MPRANDLSHVPHSNKFYFKPTGELYIPCFYNWQKYAPDKPDGLRGWFKTECYFRWYYGPPGVTRENFDPNEEYDKTAIAFYNYKMHVPNDEDRQKIFDKMERRGDELIFNDYTDELIIAGPGEFQTGWYAVTVVMKHEGQWKEYIIAPYGQDEPPHRMFPEYYLWYLFNPRDYRQGQPEGNKSTQKHYAPDRMPNSTIQRPNEKPRLTLTTSFKPLKSKAILKPTRQTNIEFGETVEANVVHVPSGWKFVTWHKDATGQDLSTTITMDKNKEAIALFEQDKVGVNIIIQPSGSGRVIPSEVTEVLHGDILTLMAIPDSGYNFKRWVANDGSTISEQQTYGHKITTSTNITAEFEQVKFSVQFKRHGNGAGRLQVDSEEINESTLALGTTKKYSLNKQISIKAIANDDSRFVAWEDGTTNIERQITVDAQHVVRPLFLKYPKNDLVPVFSFIPHCEVVSV